MDKYYLYRWIRLDKNEPFYIGIGTKTIADIKYGTYTRAFANKKQNSIWKKIKDKSEYKVEILLESHDYDFIKEKEIEFISLYGRIDNNTGTLANMTDGGEGTTNVIVSQHSRQLRSLFQKGKKKSKESILKQIETRKKNGFKLSDDSKRKISLSKSKVVLQFSLKGKLIKEWNTVIEASEESGIPKTSITQAANFNERKTFTAFNYIWIYKKDYISNNLEKFKIAIERSKAGKIKKFITVKQKKDIINDYLELLTKFEKKIQILTYLSTKYNINYSTVRAIVSIQK
jgi:hypothetical protein